MSVEKGSEGRMVLRCTLRSAVDMGRLGLSNMYLWRRETSEEEEDCISEILACLSNLSKYFGREQTTGPNTHSINTGNCKQKEWSNLKGTIIQDQKHTA